MAHLPSPASGIPEANNKRVASAMGIKGEKAPLSYITVYRATPLERIDMIRRGIPAAEAKRIFAELSIGQGGGFKALTPWSTRLRRRRWPVRRRWSTDPRLTKPA